MPTYQVRDDRGNTVDVASTVRQAERLASFLTKTTLRLHHVCPKAAR